MMGAKEKRVNGYSKKRKEGRGDDYDILTKAYYKHVINYKRDERIAIIEIVLQIRKELKELREKIRELYL
ncbi:MAG: hypothetical protein QXL93_00970 [Candidatus Nitrosocaldus sp.]